MKLSEQLNQIRREIIASGYDHYQDIKEEYLDAILELAYRLSKYETDDKDERN